MKTTKEGAHKARLFWEKSQRFARAARANFAAGEFDPAVSNAASAIINVVDALCETGERSASESHHSAVRHLGSLKTLDPKVRDALGKRLSALLSAKSIAQYEGELVSRSEAELAIRDMDRALAGVSAIAKKAAWV